MSLKRGRYRHAFLGVIVDTLIPAGILDQSLVWQWQRHCGVSCIDSYLHWFLLSCNGNDVYL